jgi:NAD+ synthase
MVGYFTKYGDGGVDILPIGGLLKTEVRCLAKDLGIPNEIIDRVPTAGLWQGQTDEGELGITYRDLDRALKMLEIEDTASLQDKLLAKVKGLIAASEHKRRPPLIFEKRPQA